jgi:uncharacterized protein YdaU (DUF1376 family)
MNKAPAFQFYASDFLADTASWTAEEVGVYVRLLASEWVNGCIPPMPQGWHTQWQTDGTPNGKPMAQPMAEGMAGAERTVNRLALVCGASEECLRRVWVQVGQKFVLGEDGNLRNPRLETEREKQAAYRGERSKAGSAGATKRWNIKPTDSKLGADGVSKCNTAIVLPLANGMAKNSSSSSSSSSKNQPTGESGEAGCDDSVGRLVGRLVSLYREKTGEPFDWTQEQSRGVKELASAYGEPDAIATFEEWLKRPRGTGGLDWPLAQFIAEYAGYSPALQQAIGDAIAQGKAQDATGQPDGRGRAGPGERRLWTAKGGRGVFVVLGGPPVDRAASPTHTRP